MKNIKRFINLFLSVLLVVISSAQAEITTTYYINDALGSPVAALDETGAVKWRKQYSPYGQDINTDPNAQDNKIGYTGHVEDESTGLTYMGARYYDPVVGRFMGIDPVGFDESNPLSFNRYAYANNNPYKFVDPDGRLPIIPIVLFVAKELASEATGIPIGMKGMATTVFKKGAVKFGGDAVKGVAKGPLARGRAAEQRVLNDLGLSKNTQKVRTGEGASIPDALTKRQSIEIKDCIGVSCTKQIRIQTEAARNSGRQSTLITGDKTHVSGPAQRAFDNIIRRPDLGPQ